MTEPGRYEALAFAVREPGGTFEKFPILRRCPGPHEVKVEVKFCGVCQTDVGFVGNDLGSTMFPCVPGHEMAGIVTEV